MIRLWNDAVLPPVSFLNDFAGMKLRANFAAYGTGYAFSTFWVQQTGDTVTAVIQKQEETVFLSAHPAADAFELRDFCLAIGFSSLQTSPALAAAMGFSGERFCLLAKQSTWNQPHPDIPESESVSLKEVYRILYAEKDPHLTPVAFDGWYADLSHRIRHGCATVAACPNAVAVISHMADDFAVLCGVAVLPAHRGRGLGRRVIQKALAQVSDRTVYTAAAADRVAFYEKLGFCLCGTCEIIENHSQH